MALILVLVLQVGGAVPAAPAPAALRGVITTELAGRSLASFPHFDYVRDFNQGDPVSVGIDVARFPKLAQQTVDLYVVAAKTAAEWAADRTLVDVTGAVETVLVSSGSIAADVFRVDGGTLAALGSAPFTDIGLGYDVVVDVDRDGALNAGDLIDGGAEPGLFVVRDTTLPGPFAVTEILYSGGAFLGQNVFYPANVASLGKLPLVTVSHGGGQNYQWYDHIGLHLASYGYVVMSHENNVNPGILTAAASTLANIEWFLSNLSTIAGGALDGHVDSARMVWIGHSRGGDGIQVLYDQIYDGAVTPSTFSLADVRLLSCIAPTDLIGPLAADAHEANFHLWAGSADTQMTCASCKTCGVFLAHDRATQARQAIILQGAGHNDFHDGGLGAGGIGPCQIGVSATHQIMRGYLLPLVKRYTDGSLPAEDFLWRQWESFRPIGAPTDPCVVVNLMYRPGDSAGKLVVDDFQTNPSLTLASSGSLVQIGVQAPFEGLLDDGNADFTHDPSNAMNGMVMGKPGDTSRGLVFEFTADGSLAWLLPPELRDASQYTWISLRACQATRHPLTQAVLGDVTFEIALVDDAGHAGAIPIGVYGGGVEEPYQRTGCGAGVGWFNEFETIRIRLGDFTRDNTGVDLADLARIELRFGPAHGSAVGRLGLDDLELIRD